MSKDEALYTRAYREGYLDGLRQRARPGELPQGAEAEAQAAAAQASIGLDSAQLDNPAMGYTHGRYHGYHGKPSPGSYYQARQS